jgi:lysophospholipase L1-like esterase
VIVAVTLLTLGGTQIVAASEWIRGETCDGRWQTAWITSPQEAHGTFDDQTIRTVVTSTVEGDAVRITLSNRFGTEPVTFDDVHVALAGTGAEVVADTVRPVTFGGRPAITIAPGREVRSDTADLAVAPGDDVAASYHVEGPTRLTRHVYATHPSYATPAASGAHGGDVEDDAFTMTLRSWYALVAVDVEVPRAVGSIAVLGDSLTDGTGATFGAGTTWPELLARALDGDAAVLNAGIATNLAASTILPASHPLTSNLPLPAADRLAADVLAREGVTDLVVFVGLNDVLMAVDPAPVASVIAAYGRILDEARASGVRVIGATLTPGDWGGTVREVRRQAINTWIRESDTFDAVVDFDRAVTDRSAPAELRPAFDSGDGIHLGDAGYAELARELGRRISPTDPCAA